ncbi:unnamed protein product [Bursaphelenchus okinawaensis]|uniref:Defective in germ line development protein 3-like KH5 domain-containing protein n=1 Tax=Bursaphelenchus okinawaensis TaxID=465554 RepID=A0A811KG37_9BILA|nr:unnamed protein product [Bursaphelenchus okinawaensis]CAG9103785.1 unnamed protein product [Bursaphelenchus okinawaensis]
MNGQQYAVPIRLDPPKLPMPNNAVEVAPELLPTHVFTHVTQQTTMTLNAVRLQREACFNQMRHDEQEYLDRTRLIAPLSRLPVPKEVILILEIHANELSYLISKQDVWGRMLWKLMYDIQTDTKCQIMLADQICDREKSEFNRITITGPVETVDCARDRLFEVLPIQIGMKLQGIKPELNINIREQVAEWIMAQIFNFPTISLHFVLNTKRDSDEKTMFSYVVFRAAPHDEDHLIQATKKFADLVLQDPTQAQFSEGFVIPKINREWYIGPSAQLIKSISKRFNVMISYPLVTTPGTEHNYIIHGDVGPIIQASKAFRAVSPVSLTFDIEEFELKSASLKTKKREVDYYDDKMNVVVSFRRSPYEGDFVRSDESLRHRITISTSYENKQMLYEARKKLLKGSRESSDRPKLMFGDQLKNILSAYARGNRQHYKSDANYN